ncbi:hypothetical protein Tdes44962_MAKER06077 [Teratosphaeria destructans]|uniref:Uncharacterized protein n=1 Tax=Teratosphaeria destructans TaxID=418781 RepID=A0A9W7SI84_9PEZI|nr:hypothetical protein Tdes44962_MAKER06077 [Teratosphaeria destructans]
MTFRRSRVWESGRELSYLRSHPGLLPEFVRDAQRRHQDAQDALTHLETRVQSLMREVTLASEAASRAWDALWAARCARPEDFGMPSNNGGGVPRTDGEQNDANWDDDQEMRDAEQESERQSRWDHHHSHHTDSSPSPAPAETYLALASQALSNHSTLTTFPEPPATPCANPSCHTTAPDRALRACACNIRSLFHSLSTQDLRAWRVRFHPDRFALVPDQRGRAEMQRKAQEVFVVVDALFQGRR